MNRFRDIALVFVGAAAGAAIAMAATPVRAQLGGQSRSARLMVAGRPYESKDAFGNPLPPQAYNGDWGFISDSQSGGCWLIMREGGAVTLAPAPQQACQQ
jgi:hypothetical protein